MLQFLRESHHFRPETIKVLNNEISEISLNLRIYKTYNSLGGIEQDIGRVC